MTTPSEYAKNATAALHQVLHISPGDFDAEGTAAVIEQAIRNATRERETRARRQLKEVQAAAQERLARLLSVVTCGDLQLQGDRRFCADLCQRQYHRRVRLRASRIPGGSVLLARPGPPRRPGPRRGRHIPILPERGPRGGVPLSPQGWLLLLGERRAAADPRRDGKPLEIVGSWSDITARKAAEEAKAAAHARLSQLLASSPAVIYSYKATGDFAPTFVSQNIRDWLGYEPQEYLENAGFLAALRAPRRPRRGGGRVRPAVQEGPPHGRVPVSQEGRHLLLGERRAATDPGRERPAGRGGRLVERHHASASGRKKQWRRPGTASSTCSPARRR